MEKNDNIRYRNLTKHLTENYKRITLPNKITMLQLYHNEINPAPFPALLKTGTRLWHEQKDQRFLQT